MSKVHELLEFHVASFIFRKVSEGIEILCAKRAKNRKRYPNLWECGGGKIAHEDEGLVYNAVKREVFEEFGLTVKPLFICSQYNIPAPNLVQKFIFGVTIVCKIVGNDEPRIDFREHSECRWQSIDGLEELDFIEGIPQEIEDAVQMYMKLYD